jgi:NADH-quinone oxidoreductase subunit F
MDPNGFEDVLNRFPRERTALLPILIELQEAHGYLGAEAIAAVSRHVYTPESEVFGVATSYSELRFAAPEGSAVAICTGLSCLLNDARELAASLTASLPPGYTVEEHPCRFRCDRAPVAAVGEQYVDRATPSSVLAAIGGSGAGGAAERDVPLAQPGEVRRLLARCGTVDPLRIEDAIAAGAYSGLARANGMAPAAIVQLVQDAGLLGRSGAYFPAAAKWSATRSYPKPRCLVVNAEEGEPGVFKDRHILELDPHLLVEGMLIAARAIEADDVYVYINGEATTAAARLQRALDAARARGMLGEPPLRVEIRRGAGGYVCGEESVILSSIEGERAVPRLRPPFPVEAGLWGRPTVINNVETLCNLPFILNDGAAAFRAAGTAEHPGTKVISVSGAVGRPGVYEVPFGTTLRQIIDVVAGGAAAGRTLRAALCGGPSGSLLPPALWGAPFAPGRLDDAGASPGAGGIVVIDDAMPIRDVVRHLTAYNAKESCGKCTPCREGTARMRDILDEPSGDARQRLDELAEAVTAASLCGLGQMAPLPYLSARRYFPAELFGASR